MVARHLQNLKTVIITKNSLGLEGVAALANNVAGLGFIYLDGNPDIESGFRYLGKQNTLATLSASIA